MTPRRVTTIRKGSIFYSAGLKARLEVLNVDFDNVELLVRGDDGMHTDVELDVVVAHVAAGRWRVLEPVPS